MTTKYREMVAAQTLTGSAVSYYTTPSGTYGAIHAGSICNPTGAVVTVKRRGLTDEDREQGCRRRRDHRCPGNREPQT
jgi:hypothetical protein